MFIFCMKYNKFIKASLLSFAFFLAGQMVGWARTDTLSQLGKGALHFQFQFRSSGTYSKPFFANSWTFGPKGIVKYKFNPLRSFSVGFSYSRLIMPKLEIQLGLDYDRFVFEEVIDFSKLRVNDTQDPFYILLMKEKNSGVIFTEHFVSIPLRANYLVGNRRLKMIVNASLTTLYWIYNQIEMTGLLAPQTNFGNPSNRFTFPFELGVGLDYSISTRFGFRVLSFGNLEINTGYTNQRRYNLGLRFGGYYRF